MQLTRLLAIPLLLASVLPIREAHSDPSQHKEMARAYIDRGAGWRAIIPVAVAYTSVSAAWAESRRLTQVGTLLFRMVHDMMRG